MTPEQKLEKLRRELVEAKKKISQYKNQEKIILNKARDKERRNRTRRLIEHGAILESIFPVNDMDGAKVRAFLTEISLLPVVSETLEAYKKDEGRETGDVKIQRRTYTPFRCRAPCGAVALSERDGADAPNPNPKPEEAYNGNLSLPYPDYQTERRTLRRGSGGLPQRHQTDK